MNAADNASPPHSGKLGWGALPFFIVHLVALVGVFVVDFRWEYIALCVGMYYLRMFGITAGYHRYFAHRSYKTNRVFQFVLALIGTMAAQKGVLWWAAHHRDHHKYSDTPRDLHSPTQRGFWWAHLGWILSDAYNDADLSRIKDFAQYPEIRWLNKHWLVPPFALAILIFLVGGWGALMWGFFLSTVLLWHGTFFINSLAHVFGSRRYETTDTSRNSMLLALITLGEGWHNNHHCYQSSANQGFFWWEIDGSYYTLKVLSWFRVVTDLRKPPARLLVRVKEKLPSAEEVLAKLPTREEMATKLAAAKLALELFPERVRDRLHHAEESLERLPDELLERLAAAGRALERLPDELKERLKDAERALERLPEEIRALLPSPEELLERLGAEPQPA